MKKIWIILCITLITWAFIYAMLILSSNNTCSWVRVFDCQKELNKVWTSSYEDLTKVWNIFLQYCTPDVSETWDSYLLDYSNCNLKVELSKEKDWVSSVEVNSEKLSREKIDSSF